MPNWIVEWLLPIAFQVLTPVLTELIKKGMSYLVDKLPRSAVAVLASTLGEGINQLQSNLSGVALPPGASSFIALLVNEAYNDLSKGMKPVE